MRYSVTRLVTVMDQRTVVLDASSEEEALRLVKEGNLIEQAYKNPQTSIDWRVKPT